MFESAIGEIKKYNRIIIHRHTNPDGDAIGSQVGMKELLKKNFPEKEVYAVGDPAGRYAFIKGSTPDVIPMNTITARLRSCSTPPQKR